MSSFERARLQPCRSSLPLSFRAKFPIRFGNQKRSRGTRWLLFGLPLDLNPQAFDLLIKR